MACRTVDLGNGTRAIVFGSRRRQPLCHYQCGRRSSSQCDYPLANRGDGKTCDRYLCDQCRVELPKIPGLHAVTGRVDYCPGHARWARFLDWLGAFIADTTVRRAA